MHDETFVDPKELERLFQEGLLTPHERVIYRQLRASEEACDQLRKAVKDYHVLIGEGNQEISVLEKRLKERSAQLTHALLWQPLVLALRSLIEWERGTAGFWMQSPPSDLLDRIREAEDALGLG